MKAIKNITNEEKQTNKHHNTHAQNIQKNNNTQDKKKRNTQKTQRQQFKYIRNQNTSCVGQRYFHFYMLFPTLQGGVV